MSSDNSKKLQDAIVCFIGEIGEKPERNGLHETPARFEKQLRECTSGYGKNPDDFVKLFDNDGFHDLINISRISFSSLCEHHMLPFFGYIDIAYVPSDKILGLSKFARIVDVFSKRLQVQERLTQEIASYLAEKLHPELLMVRIVAVHTCMTVRGVSRPESHTETFVKIGAATKQNAHYISHFQRMRHSND